ncbi:hypothetical protein [Aquiflexum sp.]|uniref:hypothetical protein n=1 Tax=Aquiflexum sp. TaxID=1872584 RepID=UPI0035940589
MKKIILTAMTILLLTNSVSSQSLIDEESLFDDHFLLAMATDQVFYGKFNLNERIYPIENELSRSLEEVMATGGGGFLILNQNDLFVKGQLDASRYYKGYKGAGTGTLIASLISPLVGLIPAIATSSTTPQEINLGYPDPELFQQTEYYNSYTQKSKKIKQGKVWTNWAIGFGVNLVAVLILLN